MAIQDFLQQLSEATGVSGYEHTIRDRVIAEFRPYADEITVTPMGSVIALQRGTRDAKDKTPASKVLIEGHMDEIGLMVTDMDHGLLRFTQVGGFDVRVLLAQQVVVHGKADLPGIIGSRPPHVLTAEERDKVIPMSELFVDVGLPEDRVRELVAVGDTITIARKIVALKNNLIAGKAFDDRAAVAVVAQALKNLAAIKHTWDVYAIANVQEETGAGYLGALTTTYKINPDVALAIDVGHADQPGATEVNAVPLGEGMGIALGPNVHPLVHQQLTETAKANNIGYKITAYPGATGTNAWAMQVVREGIPTGLIDIPLRYMHTSVETLSLTDLDQVARLVAFFCASLDDAFLRKLRGETNHIAEKPAVKRVAPRRRTKDKKRK
ncbi:MAG: M42 family peptidase [Chloroflexi bacterium]|nr:M42 family peptidase [Chloroflexota bacterium]